MKKSRIGILTGGGDCAGLNPALKWVVKTALDDRLEKERGVQYEVLGIRDGWRGLIYGESVSPEFREYIIPLHQEMVRTWDRYGGTYLGTSRTNPYDPKNDQSKTVLANIEKLGLDALIAIGGDDTLGVACKLSREGVNVIGIPKTIDKDLTETDYTLGFETALEVITEEVDRLRTTAGSHKRIFNELLMEGRRAGARYDIVLVAEGAKPIGGIECTRDKGIDSFGHKSLGGIGEFLATEISNTTEVESRCVVLSHLQRGGAPCAYDRRMGRYFGTAAVDLVVRKNFGSMVCYKNGEITFCPLEKVIGRPNLVNIETQYDIERYNGRRTFLNT